MKQGMMDRWKLRGNLLDVIINNCQGKANEKRDLRGLPLGNKDRRINLENLEFNYVDFSFAGFEECNFTNLTFLNCLFFGVNFEGLRQWNSKFVNCVFEKSNFNNALMGVNSSFSNCVFKQSKLKGRTFSFGKFNLFTDCSFTDCFIQSTWIVSTTFQNCVFSSRFNNMRFSGMKEAEILSHTEKGNYPATLIRCDFKNSSFKQVELMDGIILDQTILPGQEFERFNDDRIYYP